MGACRLSLAVGSVSEKSTLPVEQHPKPQTPILFEELRYGQLIQKWRAFARNCGQPLPVEGWVARVVTSGGSTRPQWPPSRPPQGSFQRLVSWGLQAYSGLFSHGVFGRQASCRPRERWVQQSRCSSLHSRPGKVLSHPTAQTVWVIALRRPKSTFTVKWENLAAVNASPKSGDRSKVVSS